MNDEKTSQMFLFFDAKKRKKETEKIHLRAYRITQSTFYIKKIICGKLSGFMYVKN